MERANVKSSQIESVGYDLDTMTLEIEFKGGSVYRYDSVGPTVYSDLMSAESVGSYFIQNIKKYPQVYPYTKVKGPDPKPEASPELFSKEKELEEKSDA